jgi:predicted GTPase
MARAHAVAITISFVSQRSRSTKHFRCDWLLGKTGAGKTAIVAALTGDQRVEIGQGFEPCTRTAAFYDVPREEPLLRFLDTRGLGEGNYDAASDIA